MNMYCIQDKFERKRSQKAKRKCFNRQKIRVGYGVVPSKIAESD